MSAVSFRPASPVRAAWHSFANQMHWWSWSLLGLMLLGLPALGLLKSWHFACGLLAGLMIIAVAAMWGQFVLSAQHQNQPALARLMPGHPRRLRLNLVLIFLGLSCGTSLLGTFVHQSSLGVWAVLVLLFIAAGMRWPLLWASTALFGFAPLLPRLLPESALHLPAGLLEALDTPLGFGCLLAAGAVFLASLIRDGGNEHQAVYEKLQSRRRAFKAMANGEPARPLLFCNVSARGYRRAFNRALERAAAGQRDFGREMLALGPQAHLSSTASGVAVMVVIVSLVLALLALGGVFSYGAKVGEGIANAMFGLLGTLMGGVTQLHASVTKRRHEQALVVLLPGVPRGADFNRQLALALVRNYLTLWACGSVGMAVLLGAIPGTGYALLAFIVTLLGGGLLLLRNWSHGGMLKGWLAFLVYFPLSIAAMGARLAMERGVLSVPAFLALAAVVLGLLYTWRWRVMTRSRMAWPVGRG